MNAIPELTTLTKLCRVYATFNRKSCFSVFTHLDDVAVNGEKVDYIRGFVFFTPNLILAATEHSMEEVEAVEAVSKTFAPLSAEQFIDTTIYSN